MAAKGKTHVDVAFWGGVIPGNQVRYVQNIRAPSQSREKYQTLSSRPFVCISACISATPTGRIYMKFNIGNFYGNL
jgi:hypothetical protein